ncbi:MAG: Pycsar system effector family protein [Hyphomicrobiaceae bacterium]
MEKLPLLDIAAKQLDRLLAFSPRVETKIAAVFAVDVAMLALLAMNANATDVKQAHLVALDTIVVIALAASIWFLCRATFPQLEGGGSSLVYFREIAGRTEVNFIKEMRDVDADQYTDDLLRQVWRNAEILTTKFEGMRNAFICTTLAVPFWFTALLIASIHHAALIVK